MKKSILFSVLVVGATLLQAQSITVHQTCGQNGQVVKAIPDAVDLGLSVKWANMNVGATTPEGYGNYCAWGETVTKSTYDWGNYFDPNDGGNTFTKYNNEGGKTVLDPEDDAAHVNWGGSWRMPTKAEWQELLDNCTWTWTTQNGINGYKVTSNKAGYTDKFIFLPLAGIRYDGDLDDVGSNGCYWSSSLYEDNSYCAWGLYFYSDDRGLYSNFRYYGQSVRPVLPQTSISYSSSTNDTIRIYSNGCDDYQTFIGSHGGQLTMTANSDQWSHFVRWQDGNTDNPRTITTNGNADYTAYFETYKYSVQVQSNDAARGSAYISKVVKESTIEYNEFVGTFDAGSEVYLAYQANYGYHFDKWSDGNTSQQRSFILTKDTTFTAIFAEDTYLVKIEDLYYNLNVPDKTAEVCGLTGKIRIDDNSIDDWNMLPAQYVAQATCPVDAAYTGLKSVKVHADAKYINILVEPNMDDLHDLSNVPFHVYLNTDNSDATGGYGDWFVDANTDILLEGVLFSNNNPCTYAPGVFKWWGEVGGDGWGWQEPNVSHDKSDCWGAIVCEGQLRCSSQYVNGKFEIQIDRTHIPATWNTTEFGIGFDILQNWSVVGVLPRVSPTDNNPYGGKTAKLQVTIDYTPDAQISGDIVIPETVNYDGVTYSVTSIGDMAFYGRTDLSSVTIEAETPLTLGSNAFYNTNNCPIYVPCNTASAYKSAWPDYANRIKYAPLPYKISTQAENGSVTTTDVATLTICDEPFITCTATPDYGYHFTQWSDGLKDNPRIFRLTQDTTFTAEFAYDRVGTCGKDLALVWSYDPANKVLTIGNAGEFTENMQFGAEAPAEMEELVIGNNVTAIGANAFADIETLKKVSIGESVKTIGEQAFYNCVNLETIFNYRPTPTNAYSTAFDGVDKFECILYVLPNSIDMYKNASVWRDFYYTYAIGAEEATVTTNEVMVEPQDNAATLTWPTNDNAASYTIEITKDGVVFCRLTFNANGQLTGIAFAPGRDGQSMAPAAVMTANGLQFTVTGLDSNTQYGYNVTANDANEQPIATYSGNFTTTSEGVATGIGTTAVESEITKILHNGEVLILRDGKTYTVQGQEMR